jgi:hypothetical protein
MFATNVVALRGADMGFFYRDCCVRCEGAVGS